MRSSTAPVYFTMISIAFLNLEGIQTRLLLFCKCRQHPTKHNRAGRWSRKLYSIFAYMVPFGKAWEGTKKSGESFKNANSTPPPPFGKLASFEKITYPAS